MIRRPRVRGALTSIALAALAIGAAGAARAEIALGHAFDYGVGDGVGDAPSVHPRLPGEGASPWSVRPEGSESLVVVAPVDTIPSDTIPLDTIPVDTVPRDTVPRDTLRRPTAPAGLPSAAIRNLRGDTIPGDTIPGDTIPGDTARGRVPAAVDSVLTALRGVEGYIVTEYSGDSAVYRADTGVLHLLGDAQVEREGNVLTARDSIVYDEAGQMIVAHGQPTVRGQAQELEGDVLFYDLRRERATALAARTQVSQGATWYVTGDLTVEQTETLYGRSGRFTTDDREEPQYHFRADRIKVINDRVLVAAPARLFFGKVPVFWLPFIVQDLERGRRSGLLTPEFGINDIVRNSSGHTREISNIGIYWAISDYMDAQLAGAWRSATYTSLRGRLDWNWKRQFFNGGLNYMHYWQPEGSTTRQLQGNASWRPNERTDLAGSVDYASSSQFIRQTSTDPLQSTQDLTSNFRINRRFDWGQVALGSTRKQRLYDGSVVATLPTFSINPRTFTLFREPSLERARWFNNVAVQLGLSGDRGFRSGFVDFDRGTQDEETLNLTGGLQQLAIGNLTLRATGSLRERLFRQAVGIDSIGQDIQLPEERNDQANWDASAQYRIPLIGQTSISPTLTLGQQLRRDTITGGDFVGAPTRVSFGAGTNATVYGFFPGIGSYDAFRHRLSASISYGYSPATEQTPLQERVFGRTGGMTQNRISLRLNQTFEAKLRPRRVQEDQRAARADSAAIAAMGVDAADTVAADTGSARPAQPSDPQKITVLSINTSALEYDFARRAEFGSGFITQRVTNTLSSDLLRGTTLTMEHELFDRSEVSDSLVREGVTGPFAPRLTSLSTSFTLGPNSGVVQWIQRLLGGPEDGRATSPAQGAPEGADPARGGMLDPDAIGPNPEGSGPATRNPRSAGSGDWRVALDYRYQRPQRSFSRIGFRDDRASQTLGAQMSFVLTPNWGLNWRTDYSITDRQFGTQYLVLRRDLYRWEADFTYSLTPYGNSSFSMVVRLKDLPDLKFDYREPNLGIDRGRR